MKAKSNGRGITGGDSMLLVIPIELWNTLVRQGEIESRSPGSVMADAVQAYLDDDEPDRESGERTVSVAV